MNPRPLAVALALALGAPAFAQEHETRLPDVLDLMRKVEQRLAEAETGKYTQDEQERIVRALEGQDAAVARLKAIIDELESSATGGGGSGSKTDEKPQPGPGAQKPGGPVRQDETGKKPIDPQGDGVRRSEKDTRREADQRDPQDARTERRSSEPPRPDATSAATASATGDGVPWGTFPPKQQGEMIDANRRPMPTSWRRALEEYYKRLNETQR